MSDIKFSSEHIKALNRRRRVIVQYDILYGAIMILPGTDMRQLDCAFALIDENDSHIDSVWWDWSEGNEAPYPSKILPIIDIPNVKKWIDAGVNIVQIFLEETKRRKLEVFFSYRINGSDNDSGEVNVNLPMKNAHPDWLIHTWNTSGYWNFAIQGVRDYKLNILREVAENYDFDGIQIDFARVCPVLPPGHQWENREKMTDFIRSVRKMLLEVEKMRKRAFLFAVKVPENLEGCHFDGLDVETWAEEQLIDIFVIGCRSLDVDIPAFRRITAGTNIKLYPCLDDCHASDGYRWTSIEVFRGVFANWWNQGADGIQTFNWTNMTPEAIARAGFSVPPGPLNDGLTHSQAYREMDNPDTLRHKDKVFVVQRRGGGHGMVALPENWETPRWMYFNTNMFAHLPAALANDGKADTLLTVVVADDVNADVDKIKSISLRVLLSDPAAKNLPESDRLEPVLIETIWRTPPGLYNTPAKKGIEDFIELRLNGILLGPASVEKGWLVFRAEPKQFAIGNNLVGLRVIQRNPSFHDKILVEKLEVYIGYRRA